jgi:hypothetical protein
VSRRRLSLVLGVILVATGCGAGPAGQATTTTTVPTTIAQQSEVGLRRPWDGMILPPDLGRGYEPAATAALLEDLAELGAPNVALVVPLTQDSPGSPPRRGDGVTPGDDQLVSAIDQADRLELGVVLELRVQPAPGSTPEPAPPGQWFDAYRQLAAHYAALAQRHEVDLFVIGGEVGTAWTEGWLAVIDQVRAAYEGPVAFAVVSERMDQVGFWDAVDMIGVDTTFPDPAVPEPVAADIERAWEPVMAELTELAARWLRPVVLTRVGYPGVDHRTSDLPGIGPDRQLGAYEALFTVANQTPAIEGVLVWRWGTDPLTAGDPEATYSPQGRPAEEVLRRAWTTPLATDPLEPDGDVTPADQPGAGPPPTDRS